MGTYGRRGFACDALTCFLHQTAIEHASLLIYIQHPVPMSFDHPRVRVVNEVVPNVGLRQIKARMLELTDPDTDFILWWDDDDLILPWHIEEALAHIGDDVAWKPHRSWTWYNNDRIVLENNFFEATVIMRASYVRSTPMDFNPGYGDHPANSALAQQGLVKTTELGDLSPYIYRWGTHGAHHSQYVLAPDADHPGNLETLRKKLSDPGDGGPLVPSDLRPWWRKFFRGIAGQVDPDNLDEIKVRLAHAQATSGYGAGEGT